MSNGVKPEDIPVLDPEVERELFAALGICPILSGEFENFPEKEE